MKRAQSMAAAAWTRPSLRLSSWSCIGPRRRAMASHSVAEEGGSSPKPSPRKMESCEPLRSTPEEIVEAIEPTESSTTAMEWSNEIEYSYSEEINPEGITDELDDDGQTLMSNIQDEQMTEVELWQQLEHELYDKGEPDVAEEIREEEAAAMAEVGQSDSSASGIKEAHRFFPAGKIMHIIDIQSDAPDCESDSSSSTSSISENSPLAECKIGIFLTSRSLYSKLRLSQTMISDHYMPAYRRQVEKLIKELEKEECYNQIMER